MNNIFRIAKLSRFIHLINDIPVRKFAGVYLVFSFSLMIVGISQLYHIGNFYGTEYLSTHALYAVIGFGAFLLFQNDYIIKIFERLIHYPLVWGVIAVIILIISFNSPAVHGAHRYAFIKNIYVNTSPIIIIFLVASCASIGEFGGTLSGSKKVQYIILIITVIILAMSQPNFQLMKAMFLVVVAFFSICGRNKRAVEMICLMIMLIGLGLCITSYNHLFEFTSGYQTHQALRAWKKAEMMRYGMVGSIVLNVPEMQNTMVFAGIVQLWGKMGVIIILFIITMQFILFNNSISTSKNQFLAFSGFGLFVVYYQSVVSSFLISIGILPPMRQIVGAGLLSSGSDLIYSFILTSLVYKNLVSQKIVISKYPKIIYVTNDNKNSERKVNVEYFNYIILSIFTICVVLVIYPIVKI